MVEQDYWFCIMPLAAIKAVEVGVSGIIVSNHGARQLDYVPATISALEEVILFFCLYGVALFCRYSA